MFGVGDLPEMPAIKASLNGRGAALIVLRFSTPKLAGRQTSAPQYQTLMENCLLTATPKPHTLKGQALSTWNTAHCLLAATPKLQTLKGQAFSTWKTAHCSLAATPKLQTLKGQALSTQKVAHCSLAATPKPHT